jgi:hypothetical protein
MGVTIVMRRTTVRVTPATLLFCTLGIPKKSIGMTWLYLIFVLISATFGAMHRSQWERLSTAFGWFMAALFCGSSGSVLLLIGLANKQHMQLSVFKSLSFFLRRWNMFWRSLQSSGAFGHSAIMGTPQTLKAACQVLARSFTN